MYYRNAPMNGHHGQIHGAETNSVILLFQLYYYYYSIMGLTHNLCAVYSALDCCFNMNLQAVDSIMLAVAC